MKTACREISRAGKSLGFAPTMGALHHGHLSLMRASRAHCDATAASIFVNPLQFGPTEDLAKYPRTFARDVEMLEAEGVDLLFAPPAEEMYPAGATTFVTVEGLSDKLDGASRPGHFRGVTTVVAKLFEIVRPDFAYFGQKDAAQVAVLRKMVRDLNMDVQVVACPIVREPDGLAMSSRNVYLSVEDRKRALILHRLLREMENAAKSGHLDAAKLLEVGRQILAQEPGARLDYLAIVHPESLEHVPDVSKGALVAVAAHLGSTRLIDNILLEPGKPVK